MSQETLSQFSVTPDIGITTMPNDFRIFDGGKELWRGTADQFAALMAGMTWELVCVDSDVPTHRRLVSSLFIIPEGE